MPKFEIPRYEMPEIIAIDSENTIVGDIKRKIGMLWKVGRSIRGEGA